MVIGGAGLISQQSWVKAEGRHQCNGLYRSDVSQMRSLVAQTNKAKCLNAHLIKFNYFNWYYSGKYSDSH